MTFYFTAYFYFLFFISVFSFCSSVLLFKYCKRKKILDDYDSIIIKFISIFTISCLIIMPCIQPYVDETIENSIMKEIYILDNEYDFLNWTLDERATLHACMYSDFYDYSPEYILNDINENITFVYSDRTYNAWMDCRNMSHYREFVLLDY